jgi:hypothetical protein
MHNSTPPILAVIVIIMAGCSGREPLPQHDARVIWTSPDSDITQRFHAVSDLLKPGMTIQEIATVLGNGASDFREFHASAGLTSTVMRAGWDYIFRDGRIRLFFTNLVAEKNEWMYELPEIELPDIHLPLVTNSHSDVHIEVI